MTFPAIASSSVLEQLVGERTVPLLRRENYWFRRHEAAYQALAPMITSAAGARGIVVEAGCGEGYGAELLHQAGVQRLVALDYDAAALAHVRVTYPAAVERRIARVNLIALPLARASVSVITSFQVIEHLWTPREFLDECTRVLSPGGLLVLSTPNRPAFSPGLGRGEKPANPFHVREYDAAELRELIDPQLSDPHLSDPHLSVDALLGVRHGERLRRWEAEHGDLIAAQLATPAQQWPEHLLQLVDSVSTDDFDLVDAEAIEKLHGAAAGRPAGDTDDVLDLIVLAHRTGS